MDHLDGWMSIQCHVLCKCSLVLQLDELCAFLRLSVIILQIISLSIKASFLVVIGQLLLFASLQSKWYSSSCNNKENDMYRKAFLPNKTFFPPSQLRYSCLQATKMVKNKLYFFSSLPALNSPGMVDVL